jgi:hypothetical protein
MFEKSNNENVCNDASAMLGELNAADAVQPLLHALKKDKSSLIRGRAAYALGRIGAPVAVDPLISTLRIDESAVVRQCAAEALGEIGNSAAIGPLLDVLANDTETVVRSGAAIGLGLFNGVEIDNALEQAWKKNKDREVLLVLAWRHGGKYIDKIRAINFSEKGVFLRECVEVRHGYISRFRRIGFQLPWINYSIEQYYRDMFSRMPQEAPEYNFDLPYNERSKKLDKIKEWLGANRHRIAWDTAKQKYFLKAE